MIYLHKLLGYITIYKDSKEKQRYESNAVEIETCIFIVLKTINVLKNIPFISLVLK